MFIDSCRVMWDRADDGVRQAQLVGELDLACAGAVRDELLAGAARYRELVVDLSRLTFIDARGIAMLVAVAADLQGRGGRLELHRARPFQRRLLAAVGLEDMLDEPEAAVIELPPSAG